MNEPTAYDLYPYPRQSFHQTHPGHLGAIAHLMGMPAAPGNRCRVLEIGCARGSNLVPLAYSLPHSNFVGIDLSPVQIADAQEFADGVGLKNIELACADLCALNADLGQFDYIVAHGIYSWVPQPVKEALLAATARHLAPHGVAYISYNTYPGGHMRNMLRALCLYETRNVASPQDAPPQVRTMFGRMKEALANREDAYAAAVLEQIKLIEPSQDGFIAHEVLEADNDPVYFYQFCEHARQHGLRYLAESQLTTHFALGLDPEILAKIDPEGDRVQFEQYLDFLYGRSFRSTLLCGHDVPIYRQPMPERLDGLYLASSASPKSEPTTGGAVSYANPRCELEIAHPLGQAALDCLRESWPANLPWEELLRAARARANRDQLDLKADQQTLAAMALGWFAVGLVELTNYAVPRDEQTTAQPKFSAVARFQGTHGWPITDLGHRHLTKPITALSHVIWTGMDGTRDSDGVVDGVLEILANTTIEWDGDTPLPAEEAQRRAVVAQRVADEIERLRRSRLLCPSSW